MPSSFQWSEALRRWPQLETSKNLGERRRELIYCGIGRREDRMVWQVGMFDVKDRLAGLSKKGDDLERLQAVVDFEVFRPELERAVPRADRSRGGRPPFGHVLMFKVLILQTKHD